MKNVLPDINWDEILLKFSNYQGTVANFCKENKIGQHRLYYQRKKAGLIKPVTFFPISLDEGTCKPSTKDSATLADPTKLEKQNNKHAIIEINVGKATIRLQDNDTKNLSLILKVLLDIC